MEREVSYLFIFTRSPLDSMKISGCNKIFFNEFILVWKLFIHIYIMIRVGHKKVPVILLS